MLTGTTDFCRFVSLTGTLIWATKSTDSKTSWLHFLAGFSTCSLKFDVVLKQLKGEHPDIAFECTLFNQQEQLLSTDCMKKLLSWHAFGCLF